MAELRSTQRPWDTRRAVELLSNHASGIAMVRRVATEAGLPTGELNVTYPNARAAWADTFRLADATNARDDLEVVVSTWYPATAAELDRIGRGPERTRVSPAETWRFRPLALIAATVFAVADARAALAGLPPVAVGSVAGLLLAAVASETMRLGRVRSAAAAVVLVLVGGATGLMLGLVLNAPNHRADPNGSIARR